MNEPQAAEPSIPARPAQATPTRTAAERLQAFANSRAGLAVLFVFLFLAAWIPRTLELDRFVTADEHRWITRSANFAYAVKHGDLLHTYQREHPAVTTTWLGALGVITAMPDYPDKAPGYFDAMREDLGHLGACQYRRRANHDAGLGPHLHGLRHSSGAGAGLLSTAPPVWHAGRRAGQPVRCLVADGHRLFAPGAAGWAARDVHVCGARLLPGLAVCRAALAGPGRLGHLDGARLADQDAGALSGPDRRCPGGDRMVAAAQGGGERAAGAPTAGQLRAVGRDRQRHILPALAGAVDRPHRHLRQDVQRDDRVHRRPQQPQLLHGADPARPRAALLPGRLLLPHDAGGTHRHRRHDRRAAASAGRHWRRRPRHVRVGGC